VTRQLSKEKDMKRGLLLMLALPVLMAMACGGSVVRDEMVYKTELNFWEQASVQTADALVGFIGKFCTCDADKNFVTDACEEAAKKALVVKARVPYHKAMALYNAGLLKVRPPKTPPVVPETSTLCPPHDQ